MFGQSFNASDIGTVGFLVVLEALLSADNALVLAILVRHLPKEQQKKALMYGLGGAFVLRTLAIIGATLIISLWWVQALGGLYLLWLPIKHFIDVARHAGGNQEGKKMAFWPTVVYLNLVDTAFALDSVLVAVAVVDTTKHGDKVWVVVSGAAIGIVLLRFAASFFIRLLEKYPLLDHVAYLLVGWAGGKLTLIAGHSFQSWFEARNPGQSLPFKVPEMPGWLFWVGMASIAIIGSAIALKMGQPRPEDEDSEAKQIEDIYKISAEQADKSQIAP